MKSQPFQLGAFTPHRKQLAHILQVSVAFVTILIKQAIPSDFELRSNLGVNPIRKCKTPSEAGKNLELYSITVYTKYLIHTQNASMEIYLCPEREGERWN